MATTVVRAGIRPYATTLTTAQQYGLWGALSTEETAVLWASTPTGATGQFFMFFAL